MIKEVRINCRTREVRVVEIDERTYQLGGRALVADVLSREVDPKCDPLGPDNKLIIATGLFAGVALPCTLRLSIGCKSPLTGGVKESNVGGTLGAALAKYDIKSIIFEDKPSDDAWCILVIDESGPRLEDASEYRGLGNYALTRKLEEQYGAGVSVASIGQAGEYLYGNSSIQVTDAASGHPARAAGRGGVGAVMGSKHIKAVVALKTRRKTAYELADKGLFDAKRADFISKLIKHPVMGLGMVGTIANIDSHAPKAIVPYKNFSGDACTFTDKISSKTFLQKIKNNAGKVNVGCSPGCVIKCSNVYNGDDGKYRTSGLEYETVGLCGANLMIDDLDLIAEIDSICDDMGLDTIEFGATMGGLMEAEVIPWGDMQAVKSAAEEMRAGSEVGRLYGAGTAAVGAKYEVRRTPVALGQALPAYDPRTSKGMGVTFSTSPMGGDHTAGPCAYELEGEGMTFLGKGKWLKFSEDAQIVSAFIDSSMCMFAGFAYTLDEEGYELMGYILEALYGEKFSKEKIYAIGRDILAKELKFNRGAGVGDTQQLAKWFYEDPAPYSGTTFDYTADELESVKLA